MSHQQSSYKPQDLQLYSLNVRGLNIPEKRSRLLRDLHSSKIAVAFLQETHFRADSVPKLGNSNFPVRFFSNYSVSKSRGVAILFSKDIPFKIEATEMDEGGRFLFVKGTILDSKYTFANVYLPNKKQHSCLKRILRKLELFEQGVTVLAGDFNVTLDPHMDSSTATPSYVLRGVKRSLQEHRFVDVWRALNSTDKDYSFYSPVHAVHTRIDYFFLHYADLSLPTSAAILATTWSDHAPLSLALQSPLFVPRERQWRLNVSLLDDTLLREELRNVHEKFFEENNAHDTPIPVIWEAHKAVVRVFFISKSTARKKVKDGELRTLTAEIRTLELEHIATNNPEVYLRLLQSRRNLDTMLNTSLRFQALRARSYFALHENKPGRLLARVLRQRSSKSYIPKIRTKSDAFVTDPRDISKSFLDYFTDLYNLEKSGAPPPSPESIDEFLTRTIKRSLDPTDRSSLNTEITSEEIIAALKTSKNGKSPGPDGLPAEYYKKCSKELNPALLSLFKVIREGAPVHPHSLMATISLIPKPGKDHTCCSNYRPISLLNSDMKILARILANRLQRFLPQLVDPDQVGFIPGREARDATTRILNALARSNNMSAPLCLLSTDAEKAFDRILWPFMFQTLQHFKLGADFIQYVKALYSTPAARVKVNGALTPSFPILNGTRQGCPLSPLLFALSLEPLLASIRQNPQIKGLQGKYLEHKVSAYADDLMFILPDPVASMPEVLNELQQYGSLSGFKINNNKSEILAVAMPGPWRKCLREKYPFRWCSSSLTYLGIRLSADFSKLFALNYVALLNTFKSDIMAWNPKFLSWTGRVGVIKMNLLPRLLYLYQALPLFLPRSYHQQIRKLFTKFIWPHGRPRLKYATLCKPKLCGGLALPDTNLYYYAAHLARIVDWATSSPERRWLDIEEILMDQPLWTLPWISWSAARPFAQLTSLPGITLHIWQTIRLKFALSTYPSPLLPLLDNPDLPISVLPALVDCFTDSPRFRVLHVFRDETFRPLECQDQTEPSFALRFNYFQIKSFLKKLKGNTSMTRQLTQFESICLRAAPLAHSISLLHSLLRKIDGDSPDFMARWERTLGSPISEEAWTKTMTLTHSGSPINKLQESSYKFLVFWYRTPTLLATFDASSSPTCWRCNAALGTYLHIWWECTHIGPFWRNVHNMVLKITDTDLEFTPQTFLLLHLPYSIKVLKNSILLRILLVAKTLIPICWKSTTIPSMKMLSDKMETLRSNEELALKPAAAAQHFTKVWFHWAAYCSSTEFRRVLAGTEVGAVDIDAPDPSEEGDRPTLHT
uniref:Reverse transcriptase domain-containing protein n=1 Tax=Leptobrachium leishanense TaxID=445787 RepID=A0A8C5MTU0_9ANUR